MKKFLLIFLISFASVTEAKNESILDPINFQLSKIKERFSKAKALNSPIDRYASVSAVWRDIIELKKYNFGNAQAIGKDNEPEQLNKIDSLFITVAYERSQTVKKIFHQGLATEISKDKRFLKDLALEFQSIPLRWFSLYKSRQLKIQEDLSAGLSGWLHLLYELGSALAVFLMGYLFYRLSKKFSHYLARIRDEKARKAARKRESRWQIVILDRVSPHVPWLWLALFFEFATALLGEGYLKEIAILFPYFIYYAWYRVFRLAVKQLIASYSFHKYDAEFRLDKTKLDWTAKLLGVLLLLFFCLLHSLKSAGGEGFLFHYAKQIGAGLFLIVLFLVSKKWAKEIRLVASKTFSGAQLKLVNKALDSKANALFCLPITVMEVLYNLAFKFYEFLERFDSIRALSAKYFRKKLESNKSASEVVKIKGAPSEYLEAFFQSDDKEPTLRKSQQEALDSIASSIMNWNRDEAEGHTALVYGEKGIGKTLLLKRLVSQMEEHVDCHYYLFDSRAEAKLKMNELLANIKAGTQKKLVVLDGLQYLFLSKMGGFEAFKSFLNSVQDDAFRNVFWCFSINNHSWDFLSQALDKNRYFSYVQRLERWREEDIQDFLMSKHNKTGFKLYFDEMIYATSRINSDLRDGEIEGRYFRILWEEALGNPSIAQKIWTESLVPWGDKKVKALIPEEQSDSLPSLPENHYFVLACIVRHESLKAEEIVQSFDLSEDTVRNAIKVCAEKGYLTKKSDGSVSLATLSQNAVYASLKRMNFIYGQS